MENAIGAIEAENLEIPLTLSKLEISEVSVGQNNINWKCGSRMSHSAPHRAAHLSATLLSLGRIPERSTP
ncbi:hypothetical protein BGZ65_010683 [Modicella reniformis]|uniref:Uncharacterized protein n=1 Tax=Modicella reniformis TaxID=1440133 RepID=A0A9P6J4F1_9FUNG|nr:hypothetical protein BGZ65_010683 [Modicella reniformis]